MMSATCKKNSVQSKYPEKGILGAKLDFLIKKCRKWEYFFKKFLVVTVEYIKVLKVRYESKVITGKKRNFFVQLKVPIF